MGGRKLTDKQIKEKIVKLQNDFKNAKDQKERDRLRSSIYRYKHYDEVLARERDYRKEKRMEDDELRPGQMLSNLDYELWDAKKLDHIKLNNEPFLKYMDKKEQK